MKILFADWVLPISSEPIENGAVVIENDKIRAVGKNSEITKKFPSAKVESFGESVILPGLVNCHAHLELTSMRGFLDSVEDDFFKWLLKLAKTRAEILTDKDIEVTAALGALEGARAGVTCFGDIGRYGRAGLIALKTNGLRGVVFQETEFSPFNEKADDDFKTLRDKFLELRSAETRLVKMGLSPHSPYTVSRKLFELIADYAMLENIKISVHAAESLTEEKLMLDGTGAMADFYRERGIEWTAPQVASIEYLAGLGVLKTKPLLAHCVHAREKDLELLQESESGIAHCPKSNAKFGHRVAPFEKFLDMNLRVGLGSDSVASNNVCDLVEEARFALLTARARREKARLVTAREVLETATMGGARALGLENEIGTLEAGKQADLTVVSLENAAQQPVHDIYSAILFASNARDVRLTMVAGEEIYRDNVSKRIDETELKAEIKAIARKMAES